jgi:hypothetical protein
VSTGSTLTGVARRLDTGALYASTTLHGVVTAWLY